MGMAASILAPPAQAQPKAPEGYKEPPATIKDALKGLEDPNPERFKNREPLFPKTGPTTPGIPDKPPETVPPRTPGSTPTAPYYGS